MNERDFIELSHLRRREHEALFRSGAPVSIDEVVGFEFCGWNCSLVPKIGGFQKFIKGFYRGSGTPTAEAEGYNSPAIQNGIDGEWLGTPDDDAARRFGFYTVTAFHRAGAPDALLLDYGAHRRNPRLDFWRLVRDLVVKVDGDPDLLLGRAHLDLGAWLFAGFFLLKRRRRHAYTGG
jgi:hypothetical protein